MGIVHTVLKMLHVLSITSIVENVLVSLEHKYSFGMSLAEIN